MDRKKFLKKGLAGLGGIIALPSALSSCRPALAREQDNQDCRLSPKETRGPFPNKTPAQLVKENIIADRTGVALWIKLKVLSQKQDCQPLEGMLVDIWHCDKDGFYSEYGDHRMQREDFRHAHFLRGRQSTDANGAVSFISIYPGWYPGRAPHIHVEILDENGSSLLASQIAFPDEVSEDVYASTGYRGAADTSNQSDGIFRDSLSYNMADAVNGNLEDGYILTKTLIV